MANEKLKIQPLDTASKARVAELRAAQQAGGSTLKVTASHLSRSELAAALRRARS